MISNPIERPPPLNNTESNKARICSIFRSKSLRDRLYCIRYHHFLKFVLYFECGPASLGFSLNEQDVVEDKVPLWYVWGSGLDMKYRIWPNMVYCNGLCINLLHFDNAQEH